MKKFYIALFLIVIFIFGCKIQQIQEKPEEKAVEESPDISKATDISDIGAIDEELDTKPLETLERDLEYIENI